MLPIDPKPNLRSMYRNIVRGLRKIKHCQPTISFALDVPENLRNELEKAKSDSLLYKELLLPELHFLAKEEFSKELTDLYLVKGYKQLSFGTELILAIDDIKLDKAAAWNNLINLLVKYRSAQLRQSRWREKYHENRDQIERALLKEMPSQLARKRSSLLEQIKAKERNINVTFSTLSSSARTKYYKKQHEQSQINASETMKMHLKELQKKKKIPNPFKLPYVSTPESFLLLDQPNQTYMVPGAAKSSVIKDAYDSDIIRAILEPEVEYRLNEKHFLGKVDDIVNNRGPAKVKICASNAGIMPAFYLRKPLKPRNYLKMMAIDIKRLMRSVRKRLVWLLPLENAIGVSEPKFGDGYGVIGSRGFSSNEIMFCEEYYLNLALQEVTWEYLLEEQTSGKKIGVCNTKRLDQLLKSWQEPLIETTAALNKEVSYFHTKYRTLRDQLRLERSTAQEDANAHYTTIVQKYLDVLQMKEDEKVFMHSDIYNVKRTPETTYEQELLAQDLLPTKNRPGLPLRENLGSLLGDCLEAVGLKGFKIGQAFKKKHSIIEKE
ncbi:hypothetical protein PUMCH_003820 [Australozyma saopauloensis]|uniref:Uncharacterized protein n=1 Tax=Australozyma saopauloensis TaxID=291208 RepID=A0AAX4HDH3_9ASCO|nr:hypothetical protein PUMCH_003820 [[Candida] saopauloensis]